MKTTTYVPVIKLLLYFIFFALVPVHNHGIAEDKIKQDYLSRVNIAAVVNNKIISTQDISNRIKFMRSLISFVEIILLFTTAAIFTLDR